MIEMYQLYEETPENLSRMKRGLAPKRLNPKNRKNRTDRHRSRVVSKLTRSS